MSGHYPFELLKMKLSSPLRYPGGKSKAIKKMVPYFPSNFSEYREPFLGGGSVALYITQKYHPTYIWVNDLYEPLINFWTQLQCNEPELTDIIIRAKFSGANMQPLFALCKAIIHDDEVADVQRAACFYIVNRCSFSGSTESGGFSKEAAEGRFTLRGIQKLAEYSKLIQSWKITNLPYEETLLNDKSAFVYCDPPYEINQSLYGKNGNMQHGFDHVEFAKRMVKTKNKVMISYNSDDFIKDRFINWEAITFDHSYSMVSKGTYRKDQKKRREMLLLNYKPLKMFDS